MNEEQIAAKIKELLCENLGIDEDVLTDEIPLFEDEIGLDSIDSLEIIAAIDETFGVSMMKCWHRQSSIVMSRLFPRLVMKRTLP